MKTDQTFREDLKNIPLEIRAEMALKEAVTEAIAEHKRRGNPIALWSDGKELSCRLRKSSYRNEKGLKQDLAGTWLFKFLTYPASIGYKRSNSRGDSI